jgi:acetylornithine deacetylase
VLEHLAALVACDTQNPPRAIAADGQLFDYLRAQLQTLGFKVAMSGYGAGCVSLLATRGNPTLLFNVHVDTVPAVSWTGDPFTLRVESDRAIGLGACDIKGAAACLLAASERTAGDCALLFTSDEESGDDRCVREFLAGDKGKWRGVVVAEPTSCRAVVGHRGMATAAATFRGIGGHASAARALQDSAIHEAVRWATKALAFAESEISHTVGGLGGIRFNLGIIEGGTKANIIADHARLRFGIRSRPGEDPMSVVEKLQALVPDPARVTWERGFVGPPLPSTGAPDAGVKLARELELPEADPVDFWTEASLFAAAGFPSLVYGPGDIGQAHAAGEHVPLADLATAADTYARLIGTPRENAR